MTKKFFLSLLIVCVAFAGKAQIKYALRGGGNITNGNWGGRYSGSSSFKPGAYAGLQMKVPFEPPVYFTPQFNLIYKSTAFDIKGNADTAKISLQLNQIQLAPFLQYDFHKEGEAGFFLQGGLSIYISATGKSTVTSSSGGKTKTDMRFSKSAYGRFEAGAHLGIGYEAAGKLRFELMYNRGLSNMYNGDNSINYSGPSVKFHTLNLGVGWYVR